MTRGVSRSIDGRSRRLVVTGRRWCFWTAVVLAPAIAGWLLAVGIRTPTHLLGVVLAYAVEVTALWGGQEYAVGRH